MPIGQANHWHTLTLRRTGNSSISFLKDSMLFCRLSEIVQIAKRFYSERSKWRRHQNLKHHFYFRIFPVALVIRKLLVLHTWHVLANGLTLKPFTLLNIYHCLLFLISIRDLKMVLSGTIRNIVCRFLVSPWIGDSNHPKSILYLSILQCINPYLQSRAEEQNLRTWRMLPQYLFCSEKKGFSVAPILYYPLYNP